MVNPFCNALVNLAFYPPWSGKLVSAFRLCINKTDGDGGCGWWQLGWLGLSVGGHLVPSPHSPDEPQLALLLCYGTLEIVLVLLLFFLTLVLRSQGVRY